MKEDYLRVKEKEQMYIDEIEKLKKKVSSLESASKLQYQSSNGQIFSNGYYKQNKGNLKENQSCSEKPKKHCKVINCYNLKYVKDKKQNEKF